MAKITDKIYFSIREASAIAEVQAHVLRFWESEFGELNPKKSPSGRRMYRKKDLELVLEIKNLLYTEQYTIPGAKRYLKLKEVRKQSISADSSATNLLREVTDQLKYLKSDIHKDMLELSK